MVIVRINGKELGGMGLVCSVDAVEGGTAMLDAVDGIRLADATAEISVNGEIIPDGYLSFDSETCRGHLSGRERPYSELDLKKFILK